MLHTRNLAHLGFCIQGVGYLPLPWSLAGIVRGVCLVASRLLLPLRAMHPPTPQPSLEVVAAAKSSSGRANAHKAAAAAAGKAVQSEGGGQSPSPAATDAPQLLYAAAAAPGHTLPDHVEQPARVDVILQKLKAAGITTSAFEGQVGEGRGGGTPPLHTADMPSPLAHTRFVATACRRCACRPLQLRQVPAAQLAPLEDVRRVHSYVDELRRVAAEEAPKAVADIGDPGEERRRVQRAASRMQWHALPLALLGGTPVYALPPPALPSAPPPPAVPLPKALPLHPLLPPPHPSLRVLPCPQTASPTSRRPPSTTP